MTEQVETFDQHGTLKMTGKHMDLGDALQDHIREKFHAFCSTHHYQPTTTHVSVEKDHSTFSVSIDMHVFGQDIYVNQHAQEANQAVHAALHILAEQVAKAKSKLL